MNELLLCMCKHFVVLLIAGFRVDMQRSNEKDRTIVCRYDPSEPGVYKICVRWSGVDVPGSPFRVNIMDRAEE